MEGSGPVDVALEGADKLVLHTRDALDDVVAVPSGFRVLQQSAFHPIEGDLERASRLRALPFLVRGGRSASVKAQLREIRLTLI